MPRKTRLAIVSERPVTDQERARMATQALDAAEIEAHPLADPQDLLAALREQNAKLVALADHATAEANEERARSAQLMQGLDHAKADKANTQRAAVEEIQKIRQDAAAAVAATARQAQTAERVAVAATRMQQLTAALAALVSFLVDRAPVLGTLAGAYLLARNILPDPSLTQLGLLGIYGAIGILPAVYLSIRRQ